MTGGLAFRPIQLKMGFDFQSYGIGKQKAQAKQTNYNSVCIEHNSLYILLHPSPLIAWDGSEGGGHRGCPVPGLPQLWFITSQMGRRKLPHPSFLPGTTPSATSSGSAHPGDLSLVFSVEYCRVCFGLNFQATLIVHLLFQ